MKGTKGLPSLQIIKEDIVKTPPHTPPPDKEYNMYKEGTPWTDI